MGVIKLKNIRTFSYHGCLIEEGKIGSDYTVDLKVKTNLQKSADTDHLLDTVDYVHLNKIVTEEMAIRSHLLEHVAKRINIRASRPPPHCWNRRLSRNASETIVWYGFVVIACKAV